jgi:hypothetical protein
VVANPELTTEILTTDNSLRSRLAAPIGRPPVATAENPPESTPISVVRRWRDRRDAAI